MRPAGRVKQGTAANLGWICTNLTNALLATQPTPEVFPLAMRALEMREYLEKERSNEALNHKELEVSYALIAQVLAHQREIGDSDVQKAAEAANERTGKDSSMGMAWRALGIALYRKQQFELAAEALRKANGMSLAQPAYDRLFLAMSVARLGQREEAEKLLAEGIALIRDISPSDADKLLRSLREEAVQTVRET